VDARDTAGATTCAVGESLVFINGIRRTPNIADVRLCAARQHSQRLKASQGVSPQQMWHCADCELVPRRNRGMCFACASSCHRGHEIYLGSLTRFYCDCAYGFSSSGAIMSCNTVAVGPPILDSGKREKESRESCCSNTNTVL
jgi:hypothetical protein